MALESTDSYKNTHHIIRKLREISGWKEEEIEQLLKIGMENNQVRFILKDPDVKAFYIQIINSLSHSSDMVKQIQQEIDS